VADLRPLPWRKRLQINPSVVNRAKVGLAERKFAGFLLAASDFAVEPRRLLPSSSPRQTTPDLIYAHAHHRP
jgi:hypothetical protein